MSDLRPTTPKTPLEEADQAPQMERLLHQLDQRDKALEKEYIKLARPKLIGGHTLRWDGLSQWIFSLWDRLLWKWFSEDVVHAQQREHRRAQTRNTSVPRTSEHPTVAPNSEQQDHEQQDRDKTHQSTRK